MTEKSAANASPRHTRLFRDIEIGGTIVIGDHRITITERNGRGFKAEICRDVEVGGTIDIDNQRVTIVERKGRSKFRAEICSNAIVRVVGKEPGQLAQECLTATNVRGTQDGPDHHQHKQQPGR